MHLINFIANVSFDLSRLLLTLFTNKLSDLCNKIFQFLFIQINSIE